MWIPQGRSAVKRVITKCIPCKRVNCRPFPYPKTTDYIKDRVSFFKPFRYTEIDTKGPI